MFWERTFYGNTTAQWFTAAGIVIAFALVAKIIFWITNRYFKRLAEKTSTRLDNLFVDTIEEPIVLAVVAFGIKMAFNTLVLGPKVTNWLTSGYFFVMVFAIAWFVTRIFDAIVKEYLMPLAERTDTELDEQLLPILRKGVKVAVWCVAVVVGLNNAGYDVGALLAGLGLGGLAFALAAKDTLSNIFGGLTIFIDNPFKLKDRIKINGFDGTVTEVGLRSTRLKTLEGRTVTLPNSTFANAAVENVSSEPNRKIILNLGLTYDTPPAKMQEAKKILADIVAASASIENDFYAVFDAFNDFALNIKFIYYIKKESDIFSTQDEINMQILTQYNNAGLDFAFPTSTQYNIAIPTK